MKKNLLAALILTSISLGACDTVSDMFGSEDGPKLKGERVSVLELQKNLEPDDPAIAAQGLVMPEAWRNEFWPQAGGYPNHSMQNLALNSGALKQIWQVDIGEGANDKLPLTAQPVLVEGRIFTLDTDSSISAFDARTGKKLWATSVRASKEDDPVIGGGIATSGGVLYATNGYDEILALKPDTGLILWRKRLGSPSRAAPTIMDGRIFVTTLDNRLIALNAANGEKLWDYTGLSESAALVGAASAAASKDLVVPAFSSGEITALRVENGAAAWTDNLANIRAAGGLGSLGDIKALPVIDKGLVIAVSFSGRLAAIDQSTGARVWQRDIGSTNTPWVAGNHVFIIDSDQQIVALGRDTGAIVWVKPLPKFERPDSRKDPIHWTGPLLAGGRLFAFSDKGMAAEISPADGKIMRTWDTGADVTISPIIAGGVMYVLGRDGTLAAYK
jgi:outer membrane protein assembly factor BamB